jgi:two-component system OmpR family response regulator
MSHVLLVEPDDDLCLFLRLAIGGVGRRVTIAGSRAEANEVLNGSEPVDVAITSLVLPDGSGLFLARDALRRAKRTYLLRSSRGRIEVADQHGVVFRGDRSAAGAFLQRAIAQPARSKVPR